ncbi:unnamed protein product [Closterium sp. Yama58-4]|nr:unnamed protein product [Closterium sp. Yama58-4]
MGLSHNAHHRGFAHRPIRRPLRAGSRAIPSRPSSQPHLLPLPPPSQLCPPSPPTPSPIPPQSSFLWGYLITPIIGGSLADRYGGRPVLAAGLALWSLATLLTPTAAAHSLGALLTVRAVMGLGEGVALPCMNHMVSRYVQESRRAWAVGMCFAGFHVGSMVGLLLTPPARLPLFPVPRLPSSNPSYVPEQRRAWAVGMCFAGFHVGSMVGLLSAPSLMALPGLGVTGPFLLFGALGLLWLALWLLLVPGDASAVPIASAASGADSGGQLEGKHNTQSGPRVTVWQLLSHPASWAIIIANTVNNWVRRVAHSVVRTSPPQPPPTS